MSCALTVMDFMEMETSRVRRDLHIMPLPEIRKLIDLIFRLYKLSMVDHIGHPFVGLELAVFSLSCPGYTSMYDGMRNSG